MTGGLLRWNQGRTTIDALIDQRRLDTSNRTATTQWR